MMAPDLGQTTEGQVGQQLVASAPHGQSDADAEYRKSMGIKTFGRLGEDTLSLTLLYLDTVELVAWRAVSKARRRMFASAAHAVRHSQRLLLELHSSALQLQAMSQLSSDQDSTVEQQDFHGAMSPSMQKAPIPDQLPPAGSVWSVAHRGSSMAHEGNSLPAFLEAVRVGAEMIELDVVLCRTGQVLVHHDSVIPESGQFIRDMGLETLRKLHPHLITIDEVMACPGLRESSVRIYFDLKGDDIVRPLMHIIHDAVDKGGWEPSRLLVASFNHFHVLEVNAFKKAFPELAGIGTCVILDALPLCMAKDVAALGASWISVGKDTCKPEFVRDARRRGLGVMCWTVNSEKEMEDLILEGIDGIVSDYPERVIAARARMAARFNDISALAKAVAADDPSSLLDTFYGTLAEARGKVARSILEAKAMAALYQRAPAVTDYVDTARTPGYKGSASGQAARHMRQLAPVSESTEEDATMLLRPIVLSQRAFQVTVALLENPVGRERLVRLTRGFLRRREHALENPTDTTGESEETIIPLLAFERSWLKAASDGVLGDWKAANHMEEVSPAGSPVITQRKLAYFTTSVKGLA